MFRFTKLIRPALRSNSFARTNNTRSLWRQPTNKISVSSNWILPKTSFGPLSLHKSFHTTSPRLAKEQIWLLKGTPLTMEPADDHVHDEHCSHGHDTPHHHHEHGPNCSHNHNEVAHEHHEHGPNCSHNHNEVAHEHEHGPECGHNHDDMQELKFITAVEKNGEEMTVFFEDGESVVVDKEEADSMWGSLIAGNEQLASMNIPRISVKIDGQDIYAFRK